MKNSFAGYHPGVNFLWAALVLTGAMALRHPASLVIGLACALCWSVRLGGSQAVRFALRAMLPLVAVTTLLNPLFSHAGATILCYLPGGNPLTLESILFGLSAGLSLVTVILWFSGLTRVLTGDKFMVLFGKAIPALSLVLSMAMGLVPRFKRRLEQVARGQKAVGRDPAQGSLLQRARKGLRVLSILVTWAMEDAIQTADSMRGRGYGLPGRTAYDPVPLTRRDRDALWFLGLLGGFLLCLGAQGAFQWQYYPVIYGVGLNAWSLTAEVCYLVLCAFPLLLDWWEEKLWDRERGGEAP